MSGQYIPLVMLLSFSGLLFGFGLLAVKGIQRQNRQDEIRNQRHDTHIV
jgi:hypothetical protein